MGHGHVIPNKDGSLARCGGPAICSECSIELASQKPPTWRDINTWHSGMTDKETADLAYWERNMLALYYADGWYSDLENNYPGWNRVLSLDGGKITFHIPDNFGVGDLPEIKPNWDGHTTEQKWMRVLAKWAVAGIKIVKRPS